MGNSRKPLPPSHNFGSNLREVRELLGLTLTDAARRAGLTPAAWSQIENGSRDPSLGSILRILDAIPVKFERLIK